MRTGPILPTDIQQPWETCRDRIVVAMQGVSGRSLPDYIAAPALPAVPPMSRVGKGGEAFEHS